MICLPIRLDGGFHRFLSRPFIQDIFHAKNQLMGVGILTHKDSQRQPDEQNVLQDKFDL